jgi:hypothetical protein
MNHLFLSCSNRKQANMAGSSPQRSGEEEAARDAKDLKEQEDCSQKRFDDEIVTIVDEVELGGRCPTCGRWGRG